MRGSRIRKEFSLRRLKEKNLAAALTCAKKDLTRSNLCHIMYHMKTASIREVRHDFSRILEWVSGGEEVAITKRHVTVARLLPPPRKKAERFKMPDASARLQRVFGRKIISDKVMKKILNDNQGAY
jgi:antitoxin (DNA-binding transcriptional repressor) of toxin-antitoxin stability system